MGRGINREGRGRRRIQKSSEGENPLLPAVLGSSLLKKRRGIQKGPKGHFFSGRPDLLSSKLFYPVAHSLSRLLSEIQNDVGILIKIKDGKVFFGIDDDGILSQSLLLF
jgi:hypothetical protein